MKNNTKKTNTLIKRKNLTLLLKQEGIRVNKEAINELEKNLKIYLEDILMNLKEEVIIHGRKTLKKEDVNKVFSKNEKNYEI